MKGSPPSHLRIAEKVFVLNNLIKPGTGYTPHQLTYGITSGVPGIFQIPRNPEAFFAGSLQRVISGIHQSPRPGKGGPHTHGRWLSLWTWWPGTFSRSLGSYRSRTHMSKLGDDYCIGHSGTQISSSIKKCMSPTLNTRNLQTRRAARCVPSWTP